MQQPDPNVTEADRVYKSMAALTSEALDTILVGARTADLSPSHAIRMASAVAAGTVLALAKGGHAEALGKSVTEDIATIVALGESRSETPDVIPMELRMQAVIEGSRCAAGAPDMTAIASAAADMLAACKKNGLRSNEEILRATAILAVTLSAADLDEAEQVAAVLLTFQTMVAMIGARAIGAKRAARGKE